MPSRVKTHRRSTLAFGIPLVDGETITTANRMARAHYRLSQNAKFYPRNVAQNVSRFSITISLDSRKLYFLTRCISSCSKKEYASKRFWGKTNLRLLADRPFTERRTFPAWRSGHFALHNPTFLFVVLTLIAFADLWKDPLRSVIILAGDWSDGQWTTRLWHI